MFKQRSDPPADWLNDLSLHGVSRNKQALCYSVRFSIWGKQLFIGNAETMQAAGRLYDLALWKFLPKLPNMKPANYKDDFAFITQRHIDAEAPRLNDLYAGFPFQSPEHANIPEDELRESLINGTHKSSAVSGRNLVDYNKVIFRLKRLRLAIETDETKITEGRLLLPHLVKMPAVVDQFKSSEATYALLLEQLRALEHSLESHRAYYQKLAGAAQDAL